jgi:flagellar basal body-associated protein FliL
MNYSIHDYASKLGKGKKMMHKINIIIKMVVILIVVLFLFSVSIAVNLGAQNSNNSTKYLSKGALCYDQIPKELTKQTPNRYQHVNPFSLYSKEPAPMGIADYGIGPNGQPFKYRTSKFLGIISVNNLETYNASLNQSAYWMTFQLNVNLFFENGNTQYAYWVQDVAFVNTSDNYVQFIDNIWNSSSSGGNMFNSTVLGNGTVGNSSGTGFYYDFANQTLPGNDIPLSYPYNIQFEVISYMDSQGYPAVAFLYNDGYGWVTYDNANFVFARDLTSYPEFLVDGYQYEPSGNFYDAELILGGPGGGTQTYDVSSSLNLQLEYWNGHNFQMVENAYNFGSDTAEGVSNVVSSAMYFSENGSIFESILNGSGQLSQVYNQSDIGIVNISSSLSSGYLIVNNKKYNFIDGDVNITVAPGTYFFSLYSSSGLLIKEWNEVIYAGEYLPLSALNIYQITFTEKGLPPGTVWYVNLSNSQSFSSTTDTIAFTEPNGSYTYTIATSNKEYTPLEFTGSFTVNGSNVSISVTFHLVTYKMTFTETGLPSGYWYVNITGQQSSGPIPSSQASYSLSLPNGSYSYTVSTGNKEYKPSYSETFTVNGASVSESITFSEVTYTITFTESGLPSGTTWNVTLNGVKSSSTASSITFKEPNGTYSYTIGIYNGYSASPYLGTITVNGANVNILITFTQVKYSVTFTESGLSSGTSWSVTLNGLTETSTNATLTFNEPNGTYSYVISGISGYRTNSYSGIIDVNGNPVSISTIWTTITYQITISETGIPTGTSWSATLTGTTFNGQYINVTLSSTTNTLTFNEPNGSYSYIIHLPSGYQSNNAKGPVNVSGSSETATFTAQQTMNYLLIGMIAVIVIILVALGVIFLMRSKNKQT